MKRIASMLLFLMAALVLVAVLVSPDPTAPQFERFHTPPAVQAFQEIGYDFLGPCPFEGGKMWITAWSSRTNWQTFLYDIDQSSVLGQLTNGWPVLLNGDQSKLLCARPCAGASRLVERMLKFIERVTRGRIKS